MVEKVDPPIVGIGASAGGVTALQAFFEVLPANTGAAFVVILHLDPEARSDLASVLGFRTTMPVIQIEDEVHLEENHVYVIAPNRSLLIADHHISSVPFLEPRGQRAPIDVFFRSLADKNREAFAVIMSGAGSDGAVGVKSVKEAGGVVLVQDPHEAEYPSMPRAAIATETADFVLPLRELARRLADLIQKRELLPTETRQGDEEDLRRIIAHIRVRTGHDFAQYKRATILRRVARRLQVTNKSSLAEYYGFLRENAEEAQALFSDFLISVTTFFRDQSAFQSLAEKVIPNLFETKDAGSSIRIWVPGCATGEEAYTIAMLLLEEASKHDIRPELQVFGSDLDPGSLATAREGRYPAGIEADIGEDRLKRFFLKEGEHYRVRRELRDTVLFASHSMLRDPPFSRLDLVSCRNLLIYLDRELQQQVCNTFHYALNPGGYLFLGSSESADSPAGLFRTVDRDNRIYRAAPSSHDKRPALPLLLASHHVERGAPAVRTTPSLSVTDAALHRQMLERVAPPSMLVDQSQRAIHLSENAGRFLQPSGGPLSVEASELVRPELRFDLRSALHRAFERGEATLSTPIPVKFNGGSPHRVYLNVKPILQEGDPAYYALVMFIEGEPVDESGLVSSDSIPLDDPERRKIQLLQEELQLAQSRVRATREESEAANEELRAANEELQSINEEYRSTSEELETSKEELQSINEELQTVNNELKLKLETVSRAHSDLQNLMAATDVGTLFLDPSLRIKRFTPRLADLFNITANDEGRPITDFTHQLEYNSLAEDAGMVLRDLAPIERAVKSIKDGWFLVRLRPYRTIDDKIDGVVATFVDITERRKAEEQLRESEQRLRQETRLVELSRSPIFVWDFDDGILQWNRGSEELYGYPRAEVLGRRKNEVLKTVVPGSSFEELRQTLVETGTWRGELLHTHKDGRQLTVESHIELLRLGGRRLVLESTFDLTERKRWERRQELLLNELTHRVKNSLTVIQALARQTWRTARQPEDFMERFEGRLGALAGSHSLLIQSRWQGAELNALAHYQLQPYGTDTPRIQILGPSVMLSPELATPFGLVFHELATNAAKHGAFSTPAGRVHLSWTVNGQNGGRRLQVVWRELNGPLVNPNGHRGFGSTLIEQGIPEASVHREFHTDGLVCTIDVDLGSKLDDSGTEQGPAPK